MDKHTYYVGAKPALERLVMDFEKNVRRNAQIRSVTAWRTLIQRIWDRHSERYCDEAIERHLRSVEARDIDRNGRRCVLGLGRLAFSGVGGIGKDVSGTSRPRREEV